MDGTQTLAFRAQRNAILGLLLALAAAAWVLLLAWHGSDPGMGMAMASPTMGLRAPRSRRSPPPGSAAPSSLPRASTSSHP